MRDHPTWMQLRKDEYSLFFIVPVLCSNKILINTTREHTQITESDDFQTIDNFMFEELGTDPKRLKSIKLVLRFSMIHSQKFIIQEIQKV